MYDRSNYQEKIKHLIREFETQIERLQSSTAAMDGENRNQILSRVESLRAKHRALESAYQDLSMADDTLWEQLKLGVDGAVEDVAFNLNRAMADFIDQHLKR